MRGREVAVMTGDETTGAVTLEASDTSLGEECVQLLARHLKVEAARGPGAWSRISAVLCPTSRAVRPAHGGAWSSPPAWSRPSSVLSSCSAFSAA